MSRTYVISVPIGAYHPLLSDCLKSLAIQTPTPVVALLDASGDARVGEVADRFGDLIAHRRHGPDGGQSDAILEGWRELDGDVLGWLNADDALLPGALSAAEAAFDAPASPDIVYGHSIIINDDFDVTGYHWAVEPPSDLLYASNIISQPSCFFQREAYDRIGGLDRDLHYTMDWDLWVRLRRSGAEFGFIDETLSRVLWTKEAKTGGFGAKRRQELDRIIAQNRSLMRRVKSKIGFAMHHAFEYMLPEEMSRTLRGRIAPSSARIQGLGRNGEIEAKAEIPLVHYDDAPVTALSIDLAGGETIRARAENYAPDERDLPGGKFPLDRPLPAGEILTLKLFNADGADARLKSIRFDR